MIEINSFEINKFGSRPPGLSKMAAGVNKTCKIIQKSIEYYVYIGWQDEIILDINR